MDPTLIANASVNISGGGGSQYVTNVHLEPYESLEDFHNRLYPTYRERLMGPAGSFIRKTSANASKTLVVISAGFDASEHEYASMSRHGAKVPTSFFSRFARDAINFAREHAAGKLLAVLEGGYSQRALCSGAGSFRMFGTLRFIYTELTQRNMYTSFRLGRCARHIIEDN